MRERNVLAIGVDTGGTFTDFVTIEEGVVNTYKCLSTPGNPAEAFLAGLKKISPGRVRNIVHGSTVATNAVLERKGAKTALITNRGFEDLIEIGRQNRDRLYDLKYVKKRPLLSENLRYGIRGRLLYTGEVLEEIDEDEIREVVKNIVEEGGESVAVSLLFSFTNSCHEDLVEAVCEKAGISVSSSNRILPEFREYERTTTTVLNAYVSPIMKKYISTLSSSLNNEDKVRIMQSNGGSISRERAAKESIRTVLSGPAGGVVGAALVGKAAGYDRLITFDMGGTSTDVSLVEGEISLTTESEISGWPVKVPMIDIHTVGAGGGSIARIDGGGSLRVGPESAGADPGPVCYGKGEKITVTDANLFLGRLLPCHFLGGEMELDAKRLEPFLKVMAEKGGISPVEMALGVVEVANGTMEKAIRLISLERGYDPHEFTLVSFGGAGGLHAISLAELLSIPRVLIPEDPGLLSAYGMLLTDVVKDYSLTVMEREGEGDPLYLEGLFSPLLDRGREELLEEGIEEERIFLERSLDMRYEGQSHEINIPFSREYRKIFHRYHERKYGYTHRERTVEVVNIRVRARGIFRKIELSPGKEIYGPPPKEALLKKMDVVFSSGTWGTEVFDRKKISPGHRFSGPAIVVEYSSTLLIPPSWKGKVDPFGNIILTKRDE